MPAPIDEVVKRRVVQQWLAGEPREKIIDDNGIGAGTVSIIVDDYKTGLDNFDLDSFRELTLEAKKRGMTPNDLASFFRLYNFFRNSGAAEKDVESFITNINSGYLPPGKAIELINQIYEISKSDSVPPDQLPNYIKQKLIQKQRIDEQIKEADAVLQSKNVKAKAINEHVKLTQKLDKHGLSTQDINKLVKFVMNAKRYGFDPKNVVAKMNNIKQLEKREKELVRTCARFSKQAAKYKEIIPLAQLIYDMHIDRSELISFKIAVNEAAETYHLTPSAAALRVINVVSDYNKKGQLESELCELNLQKYAISEFCSSLGRVINALANLRSHGITEQHIISLNNFLVNNEYNNIDSEIYYLSWITNGTLTLNSNVSLKSPYYIICF
jgi:hypothetical protein